VALGNPTGRSSLIVQPWEFGSVGPFHHVRSFEREAMLAEASLIDNVKSAYMLPCAYCAEDEVG